MSFTNFGNISFTRRSAQIAYGCIVALLIALALPSVASAQSAKDSAAYLRAQQMVANGDATGGRKLADSVANAAQAGTAAYAEGLYWRATLASNARDSEHAYRQIIVDYPLSGRVADALLRIGQLEAARGENAAALQHFQRLVLEHPLSPLRPEASYWVARMYFDANDASHACAANNDALANAPASNIELRNRISFQQQRCRGVTLAANTPATPAPTAAPAREKSAEKTAEKNVPVVNNPKPPVKPTPRVAEAAKETPKEAPNEVVKKAVPERHDTIAKATEQAAESASATAASAPAANSTTASGVVSRQPTKEEVDRALASAAQTQLLKKTTATTATKTTTKASTKTSAKTPAKLAAESTSKTSSKSSGRFAVQIAAFATRGPAGEMAMNLRGRGYDAYVDGSAAPYRVRIGHFATHGAAAQELAKLKAKHIDGFVAER